MQRAASKLKTNIPSDDKVIPNVSIMNTIFVCGHQDGILTHRMFRYPFIIKVQIRIHYTRRLKMMTKYPFMLNLLYSVCQQVIFLSSRPSQVSFAQMPKSRYGRQARFLIACQMYLPDGGLRQRRAHLMRHACYCALHKTSMQNKQCTLLL